MCLNMPVSKCTKIQISQKSELEFQKNKSIEYIVVLSVLPLSRLISNLAILGSILVSTIHLNLSLIFLIPGPKRVKKHKDETLKAHNYGTES